MESQTLRLIDATGRHLATIHAVDEGGYYGGTVDLAETPPEVRALFDEFEASVNGQEFHRADVIEARIDALAVRAILPDGAEVRIEDLEVYPSTGAVGFKPVGVPTRNGARGPAQSPQRG